MQCKQCKEEIPDKYLGCPACWEKQARERVMPLILGDQFKLKLGEVRHLFHFAGLIFPKEAWCREFIGKKKYLERVKYSDLVTRAHVCPRCREILVQAIEEINSKPIGSARTMEG